jgi:hypothetical protein
MDVRDLGLPDGAAFSPALGDASGITPTQIILLIMAIVALTMLMLSTRRRILDLRRRPEGDSVRERYSGLQKETEAKHDVEQVMVELEKLSRQIHGRIDTKLARLETLIRDADQRIERLSRPAEAPGRGAGLVVPHDREEPQPIPKTGTGEVGEDWHAAVYRAADDGMTAVQIAQEVGRTTGEVELLLALRKTRSGADTPVDPMVSARPGPDR